MPKEITGKTGVCALIGDPIEHTMSPVMHNAAFKKLGLDYVYVPLLVRPEGLADAVSGLRALHVRGFNVTIPHKVKIIPRLDGLDPMAEHIGAVNTVVNNGGELRGYNTDAAGFLAALEEQGFVPRDEKVALIGAGGAARAIAHGLAQQEAQLTILNRRQELDWAYEIAGLIEDSFKQKVTVLELGKANLKKALDGASLVVNATSLGMTPDTDATPVPAELLSDTQLVFDIVYNPVETRLLREAAAAGARTIGGVDMLAWQGALAFKMWTGRDAPVDLMRREALRMLKGNEK
jgi:shikimate dehydrogenase